MILLSARGLVVTPPGSREPVVRGLSFEVSAGEWVALTGPNGGGKSSFLLAIGGLWPAAGTLELAGRPLRREELGSAGGIGILLQDPSSQILQSSVREELGFSARNEGENAATAEGRVREVAEELGLTAELDRDPRRLSAGRQQLVLLAAALANRPRVLLADEITAHMDAGARQLALAAVERRVAEGMASVWVTQNLEELRGAHRVVDIGTSGESPIDPSLPYTGSTLAAEPSVPLLRLRVGAPSSTEGPRVNVAGFELVVGRTGLTCLVGPNGSGKSVLLASASGLSSTQQIEVQWLGEATAPPIAALQYPELQIFEERAGDELLFAAVSRGVPPSVAREQGADLLRAMGFDPESWMERRTWSLAGGEKRILEVLGALLAPSSLRVLDEPTAGLDPGRRRELGRLVQESARGAALLIATQDLEWARSLGGRNVPLEDSQDMLRA